MILKTKLSIFLFVGILLNSNIVLSQQIITPEIITESETSESSTEETKIVTIEQQREEVHQVEIAEIEQDLLTLEEKIIPRFEEFREQQDNEDWVRSQTDMALAGIVYSKGYLNPRVSRRIVPDMNEGWLAVDTVTLGPSLIRQVTTLAANILFSHYVMPLIQAGTIKEKTFVSTRQYRTYKDALMAPHFSFENVPLDRMGLNRMEDGEMFSTVSTDGVYIRLGGGIANLIGLELPAHINIGPKIKVKVQHSLKISVTKSELDIAYISVEKAKELGKGFGIGFGIFFDDIIDIPISVGINSQNGYSPITFNIKTTNRKFRSVIYKVDLKTEEGRKAYAAFMAKDFTTLDELAAADTEAVHLDLIKTGDIREDEINGSLDLIIWRAGFRNIFSEGLYTTQARGSEQFKYKEISRLSVRDRKWLSNYETISDKFSVIVPINHEQKSFVLDSHFYYSDSKTYGSELQNLSHDLKARGTGMGLPIEMNDEHNYGKSQVDVKVRFSAMGIKLVLNAVEDDLWIAAGVSLGMPDPYVLQDSFERQDYINRAGNSSQRSTRSRNVSRATKIVKSLRTIQTRKTLEKKSRFVLDELKSNHGDQLHKAMMDICGFNGIIVQGIIRGKGF
jgi:hypothetical protein